MRRTFPAHLSRQTALETKLASVRFDNPLQATFDRLRHFARPSLAAKAQAALKCRSNTPPRSVTSGGHGLREDRSTTRDSVGGHVPRAVQI